MNALLFVLGIPLLGGAVLALFGHRAYARDVNVAFSLLTFLAACLLTAKVVDGGAQLLWHEQFYIDPLNVFMVTLTAFVSLTTAIFSRPYMRIEQDHGKMTPPRMRLYHSMYQLFSFTMLLGLTTNNLGILWVAMELTPEAKSFIADKGYDAQFGARPLHRAIQKYLEDPLAEEILNMNIKHGDVMVAEMDETGEKIRFVLKKEEKKKEKKSEA